MKGILKSICLALFVLLLMAMPFLLVGSVGAVQADTMISYYPNYPNNQFLSSQAYSAVFDAEGEAAVIARLNFYNSGERDIYTIRIKIPGTKARLISAIEQYNIEERKKDCAEWGIGGKCNRYEDAERVYRKQGFKRASIQQQYSGNAIYGDIKLAEPLKPLESATFILYYKSPDYAQHDYAAFGRSFSYGFETIKSDFDVDSVRVGISVNDGLYLKEGSSDVNYAPNIGMFAVMEKTASLSEGDYSMISNGLYGIGKGQYERGASALDPDESFSVSGKYSDSWLEINLWNFAFVVLVGLIVLFVVSFAFFKAYRVVKGENVVWGALSAGFLYAFILVASWVLFIVILAVSDFLRHSEAVAFLIALVLGIGSLLLIIAPPIYFAVKYKPGYMIWYLAGFFVSLVVLIALAVFCYWLLSAFNVTPRGYLI